MPGISCHLFAKTLNKESQGIWWQFSPGSLKSRPSLTLSGSLIYLGLLLLSPRETVRSNWQNTIWNLPDWTRQKTVVFSNSFLQKLLPVLCRESETGKLFEGWRQVRIFLIFAEKFSVCSGTPRRRWRSISRRFPPQISSSSTCSLAMLIAGEVLGLLVG